MAWPYIFKGNDTMLHGVHTIYPYPCPHSGSIQAAHQTDQGNLPEKRTVNQGVCCIGSWLEAGGKTVGSC